MFKKHIIYQAILLSFFAYPLSANNNVDLNTLSGSWHLRVMDGMEVRRARAILDFDAQKMFLSGFDGCNRITGTLIKDSYENLSSKLSVTKMACREQIHAYVSKRLDETVRDGFSIKEETKYGVNGITLKSQSHELFFKRMGRED